MKIIIRNLNEVYVTIDCSEDVSYELREYFTFLVPGYQYTPAYRSRMWDGKIRLWDTRRRRIYRGLVQKIADFCIERGYDWEYENEEYDMDFSVLEAKEFVDAIKPKHEPRDYQLDAFVHAIRHRRSLLLSPTASGKSLIIYLIIRYLLQTRKKCLIIVPTVSLVEQMQTDFADYAENTSWKTDEHVHKIYQGKEKNTTKAITISTWQSIYKEGPAFFRDFDIVIGDEAHLFKAKSLCSIMDNLVNAAFRIGTTGTLDGTQTHKLVLEGLFGPVEKVTTTKELMEAKHVSELRIKCLLLKHPPEICQAATKFKYDDEMKYLILSERRNKFIRNLTLSLNGNTMILYRFVDKHGKILDAMIKEKITDDRKCFFIYGKTDVEIREEVRKIVETETNAIIIASYGTFSTGVNIRNLHNIIFASPSKGRIRNLQSIGRGIRLKDDKSQHATLFDIADDLRHKTKENFTLKHFALRLKYYSEEKFDFKIYKIKL